MKHFFVFFIATTAILPAFAGDAPQLGSQAKILSVTTSGDIRQTITKIVDEVDGQKVVCYAVANPANGDSGRSISCVKLDK